MFVSSLNGTLEGGGGAKNGGMVEEVRNCEAVETAEMGCARWFRRNTGSGRDDGWRTEGKQLSKGLVDLRGDRYRERHNTIVWVEFCMPCNAMS